MTNCTKLGLGLIGIGREWGHAQTEIPTEEEAIIFLKSALNLGIDFYDTAPAYGLSEERLGIFLRSISSEVRDKIIVTTKFGEHWDFTNNCSFVDHSYQILCNSINQSINRLGRIDILQVHKASQQVLASKDLLKAIEYATDRGIKAFGASVSDEESGIMACSSATFTAIQMPYNISNTSMERFMDVAKKNNKYLIINRPFNMGKLLYENSKDDDTLSLMTKYYQFILANKFNGVILTGTKSIKHLNDNLMAYNSASAFPT